jgi:hypothetical protein
VPAEYGTVCAGASIAERERERGDRIGSAVLGEASLDCLSGQC